MWKSEWWVWKSGEGGKRERKGEGEKKWVGMVTDTVDGERGV